ncbi:MAG: GTPase HflX [Planctomycetota bacterium]|nr:GTPase HflX [Planctomycetota bacterium]
MSKNERRHIRVRDVKLSVEREPAILVGGYQHGDLATGEEPLEELERLAETAGARVVGKVVQHLREIHPGTYIGSGKAQEIKDLAASHRAKTILFDHDLTPAQSRNLEKLSGLKVVDRTDLILDIFASRARSRMAKVQVSLALQEYRLPRLKRLWTHLERQTGGIGMRGGPGERQIETDRRKVLKHIGDLKIELEQIRARKERTVQARHRDHFLVCLVGYTNAGKSTLMRALTGEQVYVEDKLFATLDTKTASLALGGGNKVLLSDTVGFIRRLPHKLVASFHATLEEARTADLLLHVVDVSSPGAREQMEAVQTVLKELDSDRKETLLVFNKIDRVAAEREFEYRMLSAEYPGAICVSALKAQGLEGLKDEIRRRAREHGVPAVVSVFAGDGKNLAFMARHFFEDERRVDGEWIVFRGRAPVHALEVLAGAGETVKILADGRNPAARDPWFDDAAGGV